MRNIYFNLVCIEEELISRDFIEKANLTIIKEANYDTHVGGHDFESSHAQAKALLISGKGIVYKGKVVFLENNMKGSSYQKYSRIKTEKMKTYSAYMNGALVRELLNLKMFPVVKAVLQLYAEGIITKDKASIELARYLPQGSIFSLLDEDIIEMAG